MFNANFFSAPVVVGSFNVFPNLSAARPKTFLLPGTNLNNKTIGIASSPADIAPPAKAVIRAAIGSILFPLASLKFDISRNKLPVAITKDCSAIPESTPAPAPAKNPGTTPKPPNINPVVPPAIAPCIARPAD